MSESFSQKVEEFEHNEKILGSGETIQKPESTTEKMVQLPEKSTSEIANEARQDVAETAQNSSARDTLKQFNETETAPATMSPSTINRELRSISRRRELKNIQRKEKLPARSLSRIIHQPVIRAISEGTGKTLSRPSGMLGGGLVAFLGSGTYLMLAKYMGFNYNYSVSLALFVGGFLFGLLLETFVHLATASHRQVD